MAGTKGSTKAGTKSATAGARSTAKSSGAKNVNAKASGASANRAVKERSGETKKTNSGGTRRTASGQAEPTKTQQAKAASSNASGSKKSAPGSKTGTKSGSTGGKSSAKASTSASAGKASKTTGKTSAKSGAASSARTSRNTKGSASASATSRKGKGSNGDSLISTLVDKVTGLFSPSQMDAIDLLKTDHDLVDALFQKVKANENGNNAVTFKKIKAELDAHAHIEETIFYPFLLSKGDKELRDITREGIEEHHQVKMFLAELNRLTGTSEKFKAKIKVLIEDVEHHVQEEEGEMFKMVRDQFSSDQLKALGAEMEAEKARFKKRKPAKSPAKAKATASA